MSVTSYESFLELLSALGQRTEPIWPGAKEFAEDFAEHGYARYFVFIHDFHFGTACPFMATEEQQLIAVQLMDGCYEQLKTMVGCAAGEIASACVRVLRAHPDVMGLGRKMNAAKAIVLLWARWSQYLECDGAPAIANLEEAIDRTNSEIEDTRLYKLLEKTHKSVRRRLTDLSEYSGTMKVYHNMCCYHDADCKRPQKVQPERGGFTFREADVRDPELGIHHVGSCFIVTDNSLNKFCSMAPDRHHHVVQERRGWKCSHCHKQGVLNRG